MAQPPAFAAGHIPGSVLVTPGELVCGLPPATGRLPGLQRLNALFTRLGYRPDLDIVAYDDEGGGWAGRFLWTLDVIGHRSWRYLNGGVQAWAAADKPLAQGAGRWPKPEPVDLALDFSPIAEAEDVLAAIDDPQQVIWDVRSAAEYRGERRAAKHAGHIPGAAHLDWLDLKDPQDAQRLVAHPGALLGRHGITQDKAVITYCQDAPPFRAFLSAGPVIGLSAHPRLPRRLVRVGETETICPLRSGRWMAEANAKWFTTMQRLLPAHQLSRLAGRLAEATTPWLKQQLIRAFANYYGVELADAARGRFDDYRSFNDFFTRELKPGARPLPTDDDAIICPVDGTVSQSGRIANGQLLQAKGWRYSCSALAHELADGFAGGSFATFYLAPKDYHRGALPQQRRTERRQSHPRRPVLRELRHGN